MNATIPFKDWDLAGFQKHLLTWFKHTGRNFPWRETRDPFAILVAEKLLQQTQARHSVVEVYLTLQKKYPSPESLATANLADLEVIIQPLGLTYRAAELKTMAVELVGRHAEVIPDSLADLMALTGVGSYIARAVLSFAFGHDVAIVDTNVARIYYRIFDIPGRIPSNPARKRGLIDLATTLLPTSRSRSFNLGLLDLGALVCTSRAPGCLDCPVSQYCKFGKSTSQLSN